MEKTYGPDDMVEGTGMTVGEAIRFLQKEFEQLSLERYVLLKAAVNLLYDVRKNNPSDAPFDYKYLRDLQNAVDYAQREETTDGSDSETVGN